jgi:hypothetical protein
MYKTVLLLLLFPSVFLAGCDSSSPQPVRLTQTTARQNGNPVIARVDGVEITKSEVVEILLAGRGKTVLDDLALLQAVRNHAAQKGLTGSPEIIESEMNLILDDMAPGKSRNDQLDLFQYMLQSRGLTRPEFNLIVERQALLRRLVDPNPAVTEDLLLAEFDRLYGPKVQVRRLAVSSRRQLESVQNQLALGSDFTELVRQTSEDETTLPQDGLMPPFSARDEQIPAEIRSAAFALDTEGRFSDMVIYTDEQLRQWFVLLRLEKKIPPEEITLESVRTELTRTLRQKIIRRQMLDLQNQIKEKADIYILDPRYKKP